MPSSVLRQSGSERGPTVTNMELFFDLVYVFAITQLSEFLYKHPSPRGALEALVLFGAVWWAWNYTAWATNWIDPERGRVALLMIVLMAISLVMSAAIPEAFESRALPFAVAYVALQLVRSGFVIWAFGAGHRMRRNVGQLMSWSAIAGAGWIVGALLHGDARLIVWLVALAVDIAAPMHGFTLPGAGRLDISSWSLTGSHLAERCQLLLIIALGESVLRVGLTFSEEQGSVSVDAAFVAGFLVSASLWAIYFLSQAERGVRRLGGSADTEAARLGRTGYTYGHALMVAGVIVVAVAIRLTIEAPVEHVTAFSGLTLLGGPALYLLGLIVFERTTGVATIATAVTGIAVLALLAVPAALGATQLVLCLGTLVLLAGLALASAVRPGAAAGG